MPNPNAPYHPIIYVRGYAMTQGEIDETTADPFCGFNRGSTVYRATPEKTKRANKFIFESPVIRLASDFQYQDVFENGLDIIDPDWSGAIPCRSVVIYHYYEQASTILGEGKTPSIETFAEGLSKLILRVRELVCQDPENGVGEADFRCYLVAHSMGGLVCRAFLQNAALGDDAARKCVDKFFTYATPHNGIEMAGMNVPKWLTVNDMSNFNRERMSAYLDMAQIYEDKKRVDFMPESAFPSERVFCLIGTDRSDYEAAMGASRTFAGHGSDGLVKIDNASVWGISKRGKGYVTKPCATAYVYRSHSGFFGIVNSEESYQNLIRFLFGDVRVDIWLDVEEIRLPKDLQKEADDGKSVNALYQFEVKASPRSKRWFLTRRMAEEDSVACRTHQELTAAATAKDRSIYLSSIFLGNRWRLVDNVDTIAYGLTLGVRVPDYELDRRFWFNKHYEGGYLFHDSVVVEMTPPPQTGGEWKVDYKWHSQARGKKPFTVSPETLRSNKVTIPIEFDGKGAPGIRGKLRFVASAWNQ